MVSSSVNQAVCIDLELQLRVLCINVSSGCSTAAQYIGIISSALSASTFTIGSVYIIDATTSVVKLIYDISYKCLYPKKITNLPENADPIKEPKTLGKLWKNFIKSAKKLAVGSLPIVLGVTFYKLNELVVSEMCPGIISGCTGLTAKMISTCSNIDSAIISTVNNTVQTYLFK